MSTRVLKSQSVRSGAPEVVKPVLGAAVGRGAMLDLRPVDRSARWALETPVDRIRTLAEQRHFFTAELELTGYGRVLLIGDRTAVEHLRELIAEHEAHTLLDVTDEENRGA